MKKIIALILSAITVFSSLSTVSMAETETTNTSGDLAFCKALGFIDNSVEGGETVTRSELAGIYYRIIMGNDAEIVPAESVHFTDAFAEDAYLADFAVERGIMNGVSETEFAPNSEVTYIQLLKTMVTFLGYDLLAQQAGGYPMGYYNQASSLGIAKNNPGDYNSKVTYNKVASVLKLAVNVDIAKPKYTKDMPFQIMEDLDYLEEYCEVFVTKGIVQANYLTSISEKSSKDYNWIVFEDEYFRLTDASAGLRDMVGMNVDMYYRIDNTDYEAVYYEERKNDVVKIKGKNIVSLTGNRLTYEKDNGATANERLSDEVYVVYNGTLCENYDFSVFNKYETMGKDGYVTLIDNDGDSRYDVALIDAYDSYVVTNVSDKKIYNRYRQNEVLDLGVFADEIEIMNILGQPLPLSDIEADDVISVSSDLGGNVKRIVVTVDSYVGNVDYIDFGDEEITVSMDGIEFDVSASLSFETHFKNIKIGDEIKIYFNKDALISAVETDSYDVYSTGYLVSVMYDDFEDIYTLKIFTTLGKMERFTVGERVYVENELSKVKSRTLFDTSYDKYSGLVRFNSSGFVERAPILYKADKKTGELTWVCFYDDTQVRPLNVLSKNSVEENCLFAFEQLPTGTYYRASAKTFSGKILLSADSVVFIVPPEEKREDSQSYYAESYTYFVDGNINLAQGEKLEMFGTKAMSPKADIAVYTKERYSSDDMPIQQHMLLVDNVKVTYDQEEAELVNTVSGYENGVYVQYKADNDIIKVWDSAGSSQKRSLKRGDVIRVMAEANKKIRKIQPVYDVERALLDANVPSINSTFYNTFRVVSGTVAYKDDTFITVKIPQSNGTFLFESYPYGSFKIVEYNKTDDICKVVDGKQIFDSYNYPGRASEVLVRTYNGDARTIVVINE